MILYFLPSFLRRIAGLALLLAAVLPSFLAAQTADDVPPSITQQPGNATVSDGSYRAFAVYATGNPAPTYQWQRRPSGSASWDDVSATPPFRDPQSNYLSIDIVSYAMNGDRFRCVVTNRAGTVTSDESLLTVTPSAPRYLGGVTPQSGIAGSTVQFTASVTGTAPLSYQWRKNGNPIANTNSATLTLTNIQLADEGTYSVVVSNSLGSVTSYDATLRIVVLPVITFQPQPLTRAIGERASFSVAANSVTYPAFQWLRNGTPIANATSADFTINSVQPEDAGLYQARVSNAAGETFTTAAELNVVPVPPPALSSPTYPPYGVRWGGTTTLTMNVNSAAAFTCQWYRNGVPLPGATATSLTLTNVGVADFADYFLAATNSAGTTLGPTLHVVPLPDTSAPAHHWIDAREVDGVIYFTFADVPRILRYDLATETWLTPWTLPATPTAVAFASDALYLATTNTVTRYARDFTAPTVFWTGSSPIRALGAFDDVLVATEVASAAQTRVTTIRRSTGQLIAQQTYTYTFSGNFTFDPVARALIGRNISGSSTDYDPAVLPFNLDGTLGQLRRITLNQLPAGGRTWMLRAGAFIAQSSGGILQIDSLDRVTGLGTGLDDAIERPGGFYTLQAGRLAELDSSFRELRSRSLGFRGDRLWRKASGDLLVFRQPENSGAAPLVTRSMPADLSAPVPAPPLDARALALPSPQIEVADDGTVFVLSRLHRNIFRWSSTIGTYGDAVPLASWPNLFAVDSVHQRALFETDVRQLAAQSLGASPAPATPFYRSVGALSAVAVAGQHIAAGTQLSDYSYTGGAEHLLLDASGALAAKHPNFNASRSLGYEWSAARNRLFFLRDSSPSDLLYLQIEPTGDFRPAIAETPYHDDYWSAPVRPSPDGAWVSLGNGRIIRSSDMTELGYIARAHTDAAWSEDRLHTIRPSLDGTVVESWSIPERQLVHSLTLPGRPLRILRLKSDRLLVATAQADVPAYQVLAASSLAPIAATDRSAPPDILRRSTDVAGAAGGPAAFWVETTGGVLPDYRWQVRANGSSTWVDLNDDGNITGSHTARLAIAALDAAQAGARFRVIVTNPGGTVTSDPSGVSVAGPAAVTQVAANNSGVIFVRADGSAWQATGAEPKQIAASIAHVTAAHSGATLFAADGTTYVLGGGNFSQLFAAGQESLMGLPRRLAFDADDAAWGWAHMLVLDRQGRLRGSGQSDVGQLGTSNYSVPLRLIASSVISVAANGSHGTWFVTTDGTLWRLGSFLGANALTPTAVDTDVVQVLAAEHIVYLKRDGTAWTLGGNSAGQLADGTTTNRSTPRRLASEVKAIAVGSTHTLLQLRDGTVWAAGANANYQLGDGTQTAALALRQIADGAASIAAGGNISALVRADGSLWIAGTINGTAYTRWTKLADGLTPPLPATPPTVTVNSAQGAALVSWTPVLGAVRYEILRGTTDDPAAATSLASGLTLPFYADTTATPGVDYRYFVRVTTPAGTTSPSAPAVGHAGAASAPVITTQPADTATVGSVVLRVAATADPTPQYRWQQLPPGGSEWQDIAESYPHSGTQSEALTIQWLSAERNGTRFRSIVSNSAGSVISREAIVTLVPNATVILTQPVNVTVALGSQSSLVVWASGDNLSYQWFHGGAPISGATNNALTIAGQPDSAGAYTVLVTGDGGAVESAPATVTVLPAPAAVALAANSDYSVVLLANGAAWGMGSNAFAQLYSGNTSSRIDPPIALGTAYQVSTGRRHTLFVVENKRVGSNGMSDYGQSFAQSLEVRLARDTAAVAAGGYHSLCLLGDGTVWAAGKNQQGQLGDGTTTDRTSAVRVLTDVAAIAAGESHSLFVRADQSLWGTGNNEHGQLGLGGTASRSAPTQIATQVTTAAAGEHYSLFLKTDGTLWGMGLNAHGELGTAVGLNQRAETPVQLAGNVVSFSAGGGHIAYITADRKLWTLGGNESGQLGTGDTNERNAPFLLAENVTLVACGGSHTLFADSDGAIWGVGANNAGQLGLQRPDATVLIPQRIWPTDSTLPAKVDTITATDGNPAGFVRVSWTPAVGSSNYEVWRSESSSSAQALLLAANVHVPVYYDYTAAAGKIYYYWVRARNSRGLGDFGGRDFGYSSAITGLPSVRALPSVILAGYGDSPTLSVSASSPTTLSYQWRKDGTPIPGATAQLLTLPKVTFAASGEYEVMLTNTAGSIVVPVGRLNVTRGSQSLSLPSFYDVTFNTAPFVIGPATTSAGLPVTYTVLAGPATITGNLLTLTGVGTVNYKASQAGNEFYTPTTDSYYQSFNVSPASCDLQLSGLLQTYDGQPHAVTWTTSSAANVVVSYDGQPTPPTAAGRYTVVATVTDPYALGSRVALLTILPASQQITLTAAETIRDDRTATVTATANSGLPVSLSVTFGPASLSGNTLTPSGTGSVIVRAQQAGDANHDAATASRTIRVVETFPTWRAARFASVGAANDAISGPNADPDGDGHTNLVEYAFGTDPLDATSIRPTAIAAPAGAGATAWEFSYIRAPDRLDLDYVVERSTNLSDWTSNDIAQEPIGTSGSWRARHTPTTAGPHIFRLKLVRQ